LEGQLGIKGKLEEVSEQLLLDCDGVDEACNGGLMEQAYKALQDLGGEESEASYPYEGAKGKCRFSSDKKDLKVTSFSFVD